MRPESTKDKDPQRPIEEKESFRWLQAYDDAAAIAAQIPETRVVSVADREGDMFELFDRRRGDQGQKTHLLVRARWDRSLENSDLKLFEESATAPLAERYSLPVPRQRERAAMSSNAAPPNSPARNTEVEIRFKEVSLSPRQTRELRHKQPLKLWAVYLVEPHPPKGATPLRWLLLTTIPVTSAKVARQCVKYYCLRWRIEDWHRVLKRGCKGVGASKPLRQGLTTGHCHGRRDRLAHHALGSAGMRSARVAYPPDIRSRRNQSARPIG